MFVLKMIKVRMVQPLSGRVVSYSYVRWNTLLILSFRRSEICKVKIRCRYNTRNDYLSCCSFDKLQ